jgi:hypothetical protein
MKHAQEDLTKASNLITESERAVKNAYREIHKIVDEAWTTKEKIHQAAFDMHKRLNSPDKFAVKNLVKGWIGDIEAALDHYFMANAEAIRLAMQYQQPWPPLQLWLECDALKLFGGPTPVVQGSCDVKNGVAQIKGEIKKLRDEVTKFDPIAKAVNNELDRLERELEEAIKEQELKLAYQELDNQLKVDVKPLLKLLSEKTTAETLKDYFTKKSKGITSC